MTYKKEYHTDSCQYSTRNAENFMVLMTRFVSSGLIMAILMALSLALIPPPISIIPATWCLIKIISYAFDMFDYLFFHTFRPLTKLREWLTKTGNDSPYVTLLNGKRGPKKRVRYYTISSFFRYGVLGNLIFWIPVLFVTITLLSYRPYGEGYVLKETEYHIGDSIVVSTKHKNIQEEIKDITKDTYTLTNGDSIDENDIKGLYVDDDKSRFQQVLVSDVHNTIYLYEKLSSLIKTILEDS